MDSSVHWRIVNNLHGVEEEFPASEESDIRGPPSRAVTLHIEDEEALALAAPLSSRSFDAPTGPGYPAAPLSPHSVAAQLADARNAARYAPAAPYYPASNGHADYPTNSRQNSHGHVSTGYGSDFSTSAPFPSPMSALSTSTSVNSLELTPPKEVLVATVRKGHYEWANKSAEEAIGAYLDPRSDVGKYDLESWSDDKLIKLGKAIDQETLPVMIAKDRAVGDALAPITLTWEHIFCKHGKDLLLQNVSGYVKPGELLAVMGHSDAGITPLFEVLMGRVKSGVTGSVRINGQQAGSDFTRYVGYISKEDIHLPMMTVRETFYFSAALRLPPNHDRRLLDVKIEAMMNLLGLTEQANTIVGDATHRGISGGQKRRVTVGCELIAGHSCILADLPTNGLDSAMALNLIKLFRAYSVAGNNAVISVSQAAPEIINTFDNLLLLSKGATLYFGPVSRAVPHLLGLGFHCPSDKSMPDFLSELSADPGKFWVVSTPNKSLNGTDAKVAALHQQVYDARGNGTVAVNTKKLLEAGPASTSSRGVWDYAAEAFKTTPSFKALGSHLFGELAPTWRDKAPLFGGPSQYPTSFMYHLTENLKRQWLITIREKGTVIGNLVRIIIVALVLGSLFYDLGDTQNEVRIRFGLIFFFIMQNSMSAMQTLPVLIDQRNVFYAQKNAGYFRGITYYVAAFVVAIPFAALETFLFTFIMYPLAGLRDGLGHGPFWFCWVHIFMVNLTARAYCWCMACISPNHMVAHGVTPILIMIFVLFCGFMVPKSSIPGGWKFFNWISFFTYGFKGLAINEFWGKTFSCDQSQLLGTNFAPKFVPQCSYPDWHVALKSYDMDADEESEKWNQFLIVLAFMVAYNFLAVLALLFIDFSGQETVERPVFDDESDDAKFANQGDGAKRADLKFTPAYMEFKDLSYFVPDPKNKGQQLQLLKSVFGYAKPGMLVALMGPSGAGKTTLLDVLAGKKTGGKTEGTFLVNGEPKKKSFQRIAGYVEQFDAHEAHSTVREAIEFSARLRLSQNIPDAEKMQRVNNVIGNLGLAELQNALIGSAEHGGLSPAMRKKVTIAVELVCDPQLLFLDEPTTGLESAGAILVMDAVKKLAKEISVICTIHQPSAEIFTKFDTLLLLRKGGAVAYFGPTTELSAYYQSIGLPPCGSGVNIADYALNMLTAGEEAGIDLAKRYLQEPLGKYTTQVLEQGVVPPEKRGTFRELENFERSSFGFQFRIVLKRFLLTNVRDKSTTRARLISLLFLSLLLGALYYDIGNNQLDAANRISLMFLCSLSAIFSAAIRLPSIIEARPLYFREKGAKSYGTLAYYLARALADVPIVLIEACIHSILVYFICGLNDRDHYIGFFYFWIGYVAVRCVGVAYAELWATLGSTQETAAALNTVTLVLQMLFAGFLINKANIPDGWIWMYYISQFRYPLSWFVSNELQNTVFECPNNEGAIALPLADPSSVPGCTTNPDGPGCKQYICPITSGDQMLEQFNFDPSEMGLMFGITIIYLVGWRVLGFLALKYKNHIKR